MSRRDALWESGSMGSVVSIERDESRRARAVDPADYVTIGGQSYDVLAVPHPADCQD